MSEELEAAKALATHPASIGSAVIAAMGWLANKVWRGHRHEISNMKQATATMAVVLDKKASQSEVDAAWKEIERRKDVEAKMFDMFREHEEKDSNRFAAYEESNRDRHEALMLLIGDLRTDIAGIKK
jgi:hypothetical protein